MKVIYYSSYKNPSTFKFKWFYSVFDNIGAFLKEQFRLALYPTRIIIIYKSKPRYYHKIPFNKKMLNGRIHFL